MDQLIRRYKGFVRLKSSSYFLAGGDSEDLIQEGLIGLYKAVRDYRSTRRPRSGASPSSRSAPDHHRDQDSDPLQARAVEHVRLVLPDTCRPGVRGRLHARRRPSRPGRQRALDLRDLDRGAPEPRLLSRQPGCRSSSRIRSASTSRARPTRRWPWVSGATPRRSTSAPAGQAEDPPAPEHRQVLQ